MLNLSNGYKVRNEFFGGLLYNFESGRIQNINHVAYSIFYALGMNIDPVRYLITKFPNESETKIENDVRSFIKLMIEKGILSEDGRGIIITNNIFSDHSLAAPRSVFWESSNQCNLGTCIHCYSYDKYEFQNATFQTNSFSSLETEMLLQLSKIGVFSIDIGGGEPFTNPRITNFVNQANQHLIRCNIATNLYFDKEFIIKKVKMINWKYNVLQVSLDGLEPFHEAIRRRKGCFQKTIENIKMILSEGIPVHLNYTVTRINYENVSDFIAFASELKVSSLRFVRVIASGNAIKNNLTITNDQYHKLCILLKKKQQEYANLRIKVDDSFMFLDEATKPTTPRIPWLKAPYLGCGAGRTLCNIAYNGDIYPCAYIYGDEFKCGNMLEKDFMDIWRSSTIMELFRNLDTLDSPCNECDLKQICLGGCRAHAIGLGKKINSVDSGCWKCTYEN